MNYEEMAYSLSYGEEYHFYYRNREYWISKNENGSYLTEVISGNTQKFRNSEELLRDARIEGHSILDIWEEIKNQF